MNIKQLEFTTSNNLLKLQGVLFEDQDSEPILSEYFQGFTTHLRKILEKNEEYTYYVQFEIGYVLLFYFYKKEKSLYDLFMSNKNYCIIRIKHNSDIVEHSMLLPKENKESFVLEYGPFKDSYYNEKHFTEYANLQALALTK